MNRIGAGLAVIELLKSAYASVSNADVVTVIGIGAVQDPCGKYGKLIMHATMSLPSRFYTMEKFVNWGDVVPTCTCVMGFWVWMIKFWPSRTDVGKDDGV